jgi:hypothetical protein
LPLFLSRGWGSILSKNILLLLLETTDGVHKQKIEIYCIHSVVELYKNKNVIGIIKSKGIKLAAELLARRKGRTTVDVGAIGDFRKV